MAEPAPGSRSGHPAAPLIVRLRNWVGDVVLATPMLSRLQAAGHHLTLVGKGWAPDLLAGFGWPVERLGTSQALRISQLSAWRRDVSGQRWGSPEGINALSLPYSASSALEMRLAGLRAIGYDGEGRALLLHRSWPRPRLGRGGHELEVYWRLGQHFLGLDEPPPKALEWKVSDRHAQQAEELMKGHALAPGFVMACPFAGGTFEGQDKHWPLFADFIAHAAQRLDRPIVICPGPGELEEAQRAFGGCVILPGVDLGTLAGLMRHSALMVSNDTGPGHLAAAVGAPVLSVLGPTEPGHWGAWGPNVHIERHWPRWPSVEEVWVRTLDLLESGRA